MTTDRFVKLALDASLVFGALVAAAAISAIWFPISGRIVAGLVLGAFVLLAVIPGIIGIGIGIGKVVAFWRRPDVLEIVKERNIETTRAVLVLVAIGLGLILLVLVAFGFFTFILPAITPTMLIIILLTIIAVLLAFILSALKSR